MKILEGKRGLIFGALDEKSIAWKVAQNAHEQGAKFVLSNAPIALRMGKINELAEKTGSRVIAADATSVDDLNKLFEESVKLLGGKLDFVLHSIGMSVNVREGSIPIKIMILQLKDLMFPLLFHKVQRAWKNESMNDHGSIAHYLTRAQKTFLTTMIWQKIKLI